MDKRIAGLLGAAAALTTLGSAQAAPASHVETLPPASSYADLLDAVPNASAVLAADDQQAAELPANAQLAQYHHHHHHHRRTIIIRRHHHHHHHWRRYYHHHHHHHHHAGFGFYIGR